MLTFLIVAAALLVVLAAEQSKKVRKALSRTHSKGHLLPKVISIFVVCAQVSELLRTVGNVNVTNIVATLFLLTILAAGKSGTEGELY